MTQYHLYGDIRSCRSIRSEKPNCTSRSPTLTRQRPTAGKSWWMPSAAALACGNASTTNPPWKCASAPVPALLPWPTLPSCCSPLPAGGPRWPMPNAWARTGYSWTYWGWRRALTKPPWANGCAPRPRKASGRCTASTPSLWTGPASRPKRGDGCTLAKWKPSSTTPKWKSTATSSRVPVSTMMATGP